MSRPGKRILAIGLVFASVFLTAATASAVTHSPGATHSINYTIPVGGLSNKSSSMAAAITTAAAILMYPSDAQRLAVKLRESGMLVSVFSRGGTLVA